MCLLTCEGSSSVPELPSPKRRMSWLFPVNQSIFTLPGKLFKCCCSLVLVFVSPVLLECCPKVSHTGSSCLSSNDMWAFIKDKVVGAFQWLPGHVFIFCSECGVCFSPSASRKAGVWEEKATGSFIHSQGDILLPLKFMRKLLLNSVKWIYILCYQDKPIPGLVLAIPTSPVCYLPFCPVSVRAGAAALVFPQQLQGSTLKPWQNP